MKRQVLELVDLLFEREGAIQAIVTANMVLAWEYWGLVFTPSVFGMAVLFTMLLPLSIGLYVFWDHLEAWFDANVLNTPYDDP